MKTLSKIVWMLFLAVAFASCSKEDDCDPENEESHCYPGVSGQGKLLLTDVKRNGLPYFKYEYDNQNKRTVTYFYDENGSRFLTQSYIYAGGDVPVKITNKGLNPKDDSVWDFKLGSDGRPTSMVATRPNDPDATPVDYTYSYSKNTMVETGISRKKDPHVWVSTYTYDDHGNLLSLVFTQDGEWLSTIEQGDFDNKMMSDSYGNPVAWKFPGKNNRGFEKTTVKTMGVTTDYVYKYEYNKAGYPIAAEAFNKGSDFVVEILTFSYKPMR